MAALAKLGRAKEALRLATDFVAMIGRPQNTTLRNAYGHLHAITTGTTIYYQPTDGATNYHTCEPFDGALAKVVQRHWTALSEEAIADLRAAVETQKDAAMVEYEAEFNEILRG